MDNYIWITAQKEMLHHYPGAPDEVDYLKYLHRHIFHFKVYIEVFHDNRDVEFIMFKHKVEEYLEHVKQKLLKKSCEMMSDYLHDLLLQDYPGRKMMISVSEDKENGSFKTYDKT